jgi:hypothetical protein
MPLNIMSLSITVQNIMSLSIMPLNIMSLSITVQDIMSLSMETLGIVANYSAFFNLAPHFY